MKLLAFAASSSRHSLNRQIVDYAVQVLQTSLDSDASVQRLDLNDFEMPIYSIDREKEDGIPAAAVSFLKAIRDADAILISLAEHNGSYTAAYKNIFDWMSRLDAKVYQDRPMVLLSTSPGARGGASVLNSAVDSMQYFGGQVKAHLAIPRFNEVFDTETGQLTDQKLAVLLRDALATLL
ncbi:MAG: NAD(P)H-dependent oxidoreductase [Pseudomonadota bacterium]